MIKKRLSLALAFCSLTAVFLLGSQPVKAQEVDNFVINKFSGDYVIDNKAIGGSLQVTETIDLTYSAQNHGILRAVPDSYNGYKTKLKIQSVERDGKQEPFTTYKENGNLVLKIGDANQTITGSHQYKITYHQERIINFNGDQNFYWDINGTEWKQTFQLVEAVVHYKSGPIDSEKASCFTGSFGSSNKNCFVTPKEDGIRVTAQNLKANETLTIRTPVSAQFKQPGLTQKITDNIASLIGLLVGISIAIAAFFIWNKHGKDYKDRGIIVPEYEPPANLTPGEVGLLADYSVDNRDITATLIDLAVRGYVKINEDVSKNWAFITKRKYQLELKRTDFVALRAHEQTLLGALFPQQTIGAISDLSKADKIKMAAAVIKIKVELKENLIKKYGLIEGSLATKALIIAWIGMAALLGFGVLTQSGGSFAGLFIGGLALVAFGSKMQRRSHAGVEAHEKIQGLKLYMNTAEKQRFKMMQSVERPYAEPSKTVELFEKLLPFAVALGVEKSWAKQFDSILTEAPGWYGSNSANAFTAGYIASSIGDATQSFSSNFASSTTDSSSSSGGGFSGGGGGGGGGGGW